MHLKTTREFKQSSASLYIVVTRYYMFVNKIVYEDIMHSIERAELRDVIDITDNSFTLQRFIHGIIVELNSLIAAMLFKDRPELSLLARELIISKTG